MTPVRVASRMSVHGTSFNAAAGGGAGGGADGGVVLSNQHSNNNNHHNNNNHNAVVRALNRIRASGTYMAHAMVGGSGGSRQESFHSKGPWLGSHFSPAGGSVHSRGGSTQSKRVGVLIGDGGSVQSRAGSTGQPGQGQGQGQGAAAVSNKSKGSVHSSFRSSIHAFMMPSHAVSKTNNHPHNNHTYNHPHNNHTYHPTNHPHTYHHTNNKVRPSQRANAVSNVHR